MRAVLVGALLEAPSSQLRVSVAPDGSLESGPAWTIPGRGHPSVAAGVLSGGRAAAGVDSWGPYFDSFTTYSFASSDALAAAAAMREESPDAEWYLQTDDKTLLLPQNILPLVAQYNSSRPLILGECVGCPKANCPGASDAGAPSVNGGAGFLISRGLMAALVPALGGCMEAFVHFDGAARLVACANKLFPPVRELSTAAFDAAEARIGEESQAAGFADALAFMEQDVAATRRAAGNDVLQCIPSLSSSTLEQIKTPTYYTPGPQLVTTFGCSGLCRRLWAKLRPAVEARKPVTWQTLRDLAG